MSPKGLPLPSGQPRWQLLSTLVGSLTLDHKLTGHLALHVSCVCCAPDPRLSLTCPCPRSPEPGLTAAPAPLPCCPQPSRAMPHCAAAATPSGARPLPLTAATRGIPGRERTLSQRFAGSPFTIYISALLKKMGVDGLAERKVPGGVPEPRIPNQAFWGGLNRQAVPGRDSYPTSGPRGCL